MRFPPKASPHRTIEDRVATSEASARVAAGSRHGFQHSASRNHRTPEFPGSRNNRFLNHGHALRIHLPRQIAARHITPSAARRIASRFSIASGFSSLAITGVSFPLAESAVSQQHVFRSAHKTHGNVVRAMFESEGQISASFGVSAGTRASLRAD